MKFGKKLSEQAVADWEAHYLNYKGLKQILHGLSNAPSQDSFKAEGDFLSALLQAIDGVNEFYAGKEADFARRLEECAKVLAAPDSWVLETPELDDAEVGEPDFPRVVAALKAGEHVAEEKLEALHAFLALCDEVDQLRKFSVRGLTRSLSRGASAPFSQIQPLHS